VTGALTAATDPRQAATNRIVLRFAIFGGSVVEKTSLNVVQGSI
jgi:hypothetical protein